MAAKLLTARTVERLCDSLRRLVEQIRSHEREILDICTRKAGMPRQHFIKVFPGNEGSRRWLTAEINGNSAWSVGPWTRSSRMFVAPSGATTPCAAGHGVSR